jgi:hypothetical protein
MDGSKFYAYNFAANWRNDDLYSQLTTIKRSPKSLLSVDNIKYYLDYSYSKDIASRILSSSDREEMMK